MSVIKLQLTVKSLCINNHNFTVKFYYQFYGTTHKNKKKSQVPKTLDIPNYVLQ